MTARSLLVATAVAAVTTLVVPHPAAAQTADARFPAAGSGWVVREKASGSFGSGTVDYTARVVGERPWQDKAFLALEIDRGSGDKRTVYYDPEYRVVAIVRGDQILTSFEPAATLYQWPLTVGKTWRNVLRVYDGEARRTFSNVTTDVSVKAYEDVKTPAGTFKAFRVVTSSRFLETTRWYVPELGVTVKIVEERTRDHGRGYGSRETEVLSLDLK